MVWNIDYDKIVTFIGQRRKETGGYGATPRLPATIQDTFQAVAVLGTVAEGGVVSLPPPTTDRPLRDYVARCLAAPWPGPAVTCRLLLLARLLGLAVDDRRVRAYLAAALTREPSLETAYFVTLTATGVLEIEPRELLRDLPLELPAPPTVSEVAMFLAVNKESGQEVAHGERLASWLRRSQNGDGGFGFFPGTTSFIENCHAALAALALLAARPEKPAAARAFLVSCQTGSGGFARNPKAAPFLDSTWHGVHAFRLLGPMLRDP